MNGGELPRWRRDGRKLYYIAGTLLMAVSVSSETTFALSEPQTLLDDPCFGGAGGAYRATMSPPADNGS